MCFRAEQTRDLCHSRLSYHRRIIPVIGSLKNWPLKSYACVYSKGVMIRAAENFLLLMGVFVGYEHIGGSFHVQ
jgi:hypothetical protein